ncbi:hypothetical protein INT48_003636 [Thamnidium elegans]|uniref:Tc1-like transposase DDE domain-containing protein n=1 Tax=Thamnidium elegans TaxID=101142 RepID=A0A8H7SRS2_9FUNG|nr:hypothetical protein INT48_003636 [Thamnidium elegans]
MPKKNRSKITKTTIETRQNICDDRFTRFMNISDICIKYDVANSTVRDILKRYQTDNLVAYKPRGGARNVEIQQLHTNYLKQLIDEEDQENIFTLEQLKLKLLTEFPNHFTSFNSIGVNSLRLHFDQHLQVTMQRVDEVKNVQSNEKEKRVYCQGLTKHGVRYMTNCVFVAKSSFKICVITGRARSIKGKRSSVLTKTKKSNLVSMIGAISARKIESLQHVIKQDESVLKEYFIQLIQCLDKTNQSMFVIMDRTCFESCIIQLFEQSRHTLYYLPTGFDAFNPMYTCFGNLRHYLKRTFDCDSIDDWVNNCQVDESECKKWIKGSVDSILQYNYNYKS